MKTIEYTCVGWHITEFGEYIYTIITSDGDFFKFRSPFENVYLLGATYCVESPDINLYEIYRNSDSVFADISRLREAIEVRIRDIRNRAGR